MANNVIWTEDDIAKVQLGIALGLSVDQIHSGSNFAGRGITSQDILLKAVELKLVKSRESFEASV